MSNVRTVSDTKREFYGLHTRPINSIYRRFVEELLVEAHLLSVNNDFHYDPIFALGVASSFERFMQGYSPEEDKQSIFKAICKAVGGDAGQYRQDADAVLENAKQLSVTDLLAQISPDSHTDGANVLVATLKGIADNKQFKYSRLFAIGVYTLLGEGNADLLKDEAELKTILTELSDALNLVPDKLQKDLELYRGNLDKFDQLLIAVADTLEADRKKRLPKDPTPEDPAPAVSEG